MDFWKNLRAVLTHPDLLREMEAEQQHSAQIEQELAECVDQAELDKFLFERECEKLRNEAGEFRSALLAVSPKVSSTEEMKRFYGLIAPYLDRYGITMFHAAKRLTGINIYTQFPYEDKRGLFEAADGHMLLRYLTAAQFHAVTWEVVPGACYEKAVLGKVDATTPEYQEFERELYVKTLKNLGFQSILSPAPEQARGLFQQKNEKKRGEAR